MPSTATNDEPPKPPATPAPAHPSPTSPRSGANAAQSWVASSTNTSEPHRIPDQRQRQSSATAGPSVLEAVLERVTYASEGTGGAIAGQAAMAGTLSASAQSGGAGDVARQGAATVSSQT